MSLGINGNVSHLDSTYDVLNKINENAYGIIELKKDINGNDYGEHRALTLKERIWNFFFGIDTGMKKFLHFVCSPEGKSHLDNIFSYKQQPGADLKTIGTKALDIITVLGSKIKEYNNAVDTDNKKWYRRWGLKPIIPSLTLPTIRLRMVEKNNVVDMDVGYKNDQILKTAVGGNNIEKVQPKEGVIVPDSVNDNDENAVIPVPGTPQYNAAVSGPLVMQPPGTPIGDDDDKNEDDLPPETPANVDPQTLYQEPL